MRQASAALAHDLRAPLTRVRAVLETALGEGDPDAQRRCMKRALANCDELAELLASLLRISDMEQGATPLPLASVDLAELATFVHEAFEPSVVDGGRGFTLSIDQPAMALVNRALVVQAVANLLDNAQIHTPVGTSISLSVVAEAPFVRISVSDDGPGVPPSSLHRLTERFFRAKRGSSPPGHGLGLSMVSAVVGAHAARLEISDNGPGLRVSLTFPMVPDESAGV